jgi:hypothetical protein
MQVDVEKLAVDLSRAAKKWEVLGEEKIVVGRNADMLDVLRRLSSLLDAVGPYTRAKALWVETAAALREAGGHKERAAVVAEQHASRCGRQVEFCGESFNEIVMKWAFDTEKAWSPVETRIAAFEYERHAKGRPVEELIDQFNEDPVLSRPSSWGEGLDLWWMGGS